jgi:MFS family permease
VLGGLALVATNLVFVVLVPLGVLLYPVVGLLALGAGLAIPSVTSVISNRTSQLAQGRLMGGIQAILSLALILGPILAGLAFDYVGVAAPYLLGGSLAALALLVAARSLSGSRQDERDSKGSDA